MARASTYTMIPLDRVAKIIGVDPWHFNGIYFENATRVSCPDFWLQYDWQATGKLSREVLANAVAQAEEIVSSYLNWKPVSQWEVETIQLPRYYKTEQRSFFQSTYRLKSVITSWKYVHQIGAKGSTKIDTPNCVFSDEDGDGIDETVTVTVATTVTDEEELRVFYPDKNGHRTWEIRPLTSVSISGGIATITFPKYLIVLEDLMEKYPVDSDRHISVDGSDNTNFLQTVDVYRIYNDTSQQIVFHADPRFDDCDSVPCDPSTETGCGIIDDIRLGIISPTRANYADGAWTKAYFNILPDRVTIYYRAGLKDDNLDRPYWQTPPAYERMISYFALSKLNTKLCGCDNLREHWMFLTEDMSFANAEGSHNVPWDIMNNPFGTSRAAIDFWKFIQEKKIGEAI